MLKKLTMRKKIIWVFGKQRVFSFNNKSDFTVFKKRDFYFDLPTALSMPKKMYMAPTPGVR